MGGEKIPEPAATRKEEAGVYKQITGDDIARILRERGWMGLAEEQAPAELRLWVERTALLLGPRAADEEDLRALLELIFHYDAREIFDSTDAQTVLGRTGARTVIRELGREVLAGPEVDSDRLKQIFERLKERTIFRGRELFHPLRLALAGRAGEGEMDRVILLLDDAARLPLAVRVKSARERMLEFCTRLD